jgi:hypothetical protein
MVKRRFLVAFLRKLVAFFVLKSCVYEKKAVILQRILIWSQNAQNDSKK